MKVDVARRMSTAEARTRVCVDKTSIASVAISAMTTRGPYSIVATDSLELISWQTLDCLQEVLSAPRRQR